jgi:hypothetical protein
MSNKRSKKVDSTNKKDTNNNKLISFIYVGKETKFITKLFRNTNINVSYKTKNTKEKLLAYKQQCYDKYKENTYTHYKFQIVESNI